MDSICGENEILDLDTGECISFSTSGGLNILNKDAPGGISKVIIRYKDSYFTGTREKLLHLLLQNGETTHTIKEMLDSSDEPTRKPKGAPVFSGILVIKEITLDLLRLPKDMTYIPDFMSITESNRLFSKIKDRYFYGNNYVNIDRKISDQVIIQPYFDSWIVCLLDIFIKGGYIDKYPDNIFINYLPKNYGMRPHMDDPKYDNKVLILSLGTTSLMSFNNLQDSTVIELPVLSGSLMILEGDSRYKYSREIKNTQISTYNIKGFPQQKWYREDRISIVFRFLKK